jgi:hypothetical protein
MDYHAIHFDYTYVVNYRVWLDEHQVLWFENIHQLYLIQFQMNEERLVDQIYYHFFLQLFDDLE